MVKGRVTKAYASGTKIFIMFKPESGNIQGNINLPASEWMIKEVWSRPINSELFANVVAKKLIGREYDIPLFGQMNPKQRKQDLKRRGLWMQKDLKREIQFDEKKENKQTLKYSEMRNQILAIKGIDRLEEFDFSGKRITFFIQEEVKEEQSLIETFEKLSFIDGIKSFKKLEVR